MDLLETAADLAGKRLARSELSLHLVRECQIGRSFQRVRVFRTGHAALDLQALAEERLGLRVLALRIVNTG